MAKYLLFLCAIILSGCTSQVWQAPNYKEQITGFYGVENKPFIIVTGKTYSYIFDAPASLKQVLQESRKTEFIPRYENFKLDKNNNITGVLKLIAYDVEDPAALEQLGFIKNSQFGSQEFSVALTGKRYTVEGDIKLEKLEDEHFITVETPTSGIATIGKIIATPAAIAIDASIMIPVGAMFAALGVATAIDQAN